MPKLSKKELDRKADFLAEKSRLLALFNNQCSTSEELQMVSHKIAALVEASLKKSGSNSTSSDSEDYEQSNKDM